MKESDKKIKRSNLDGLGMFHSFIEWLASFGGIVRKVFFGKLSLSASESGPFNYEANRLNNIYYLKLFEVFITLWHSVNFQSEPIVYDWNYVN